MEGLHWWTSASSYVMKQTCFTILTSRMAFLVYGSWIWALCLAQASLGQWFSKCGLRTPEGSWDTFRRSIGSSLFQWHVYVKLDFLHMIKPNRILQQVERWCRYANLVIFYKLDIQVICKNVEEYYSQKKEKSLKDTVFSIKI